MWDFANHLSSFLSYFQFTGGGKFPRFEETSDTSVDLNVVNDEMKLRNLENMYKRHGKNNTSSFY